MSLSLLNKTKRNENENSEEEKDINEATLLEDLESLGIPTDFTKLVDDLNLEDSDCEEADWRMHRR